MVKEKIDRFEERCRHCGETRDTCVAELNGQQGDFSEGPDEDACAGCEVADRVWPSSYCDACRMSGEDE